MKKSALIVDDSASARLVLAGMLEAYDLAVDSCESAEDALEYLDTNRPDVIFMDHLMPGMDGFEAVRVIKKNPDTAMIPIMMYTSQEGEVYVGQARALGAVGVLPKTVKPVEVSKVLASLHLVDDEHADSSLQAAPSETAPPGMEGSSSEPDLRALLQDLFDQQRIILQHELRETHSTLKAQLDSERRQRKITELEPGRAGSDPRPSKARYRLGMLLVAALLLAALVVWQGIAMVKLENQYRLLARNVRNAADMTSSAAVQPLPQPADKDAALATTLDALQWGANLSARYEFDEIALGERRLQIFDELLEHLMTAGFTGAVVVEVHVGDFCMVTDNSGQFDLAPPHYSADYCEQIGFDATESRNLGLRQSIAFANFVVMTEERTGGKIRFDISSHGNQQPLLTYPPTPAAVTAGDWNAIAAINHRVEVILQPYSP